MPQALCHPSRRELLNRLISEAEKSQLWVRSSQSRAHTHTHIHAMSPRTVHIPSQVTMPDTVLSSSSSGRARGQSLVDECPHAPMCRCPGLLDQVTPVESTALCTPHR